jgi:hypothetical protein
MLGENYQKYIAFVVPYGLTVSTLYLFGYWGSFGINIFDYIGLSDVVKIAISQLAHYGAFILLGSMIADIFVTPYTLRAFPPGGGVDTPTGRYVNKYWRIPALLLVVYAMYLIFYTNNPQRFFNASTLILPLVSIAISSAPSVVRAIPNSRLRASVMYPVIAVAVCSFGWGTLDAEKQKKRESTLLINDVSLRQNYLGQAGGYVFLWNKETDSVRIVAMSEVKSMQYKVKEDAFEILWAKQPPKIPTPAP